jgi:hypothetical protein
MKDDHILYSPFGEVVLPKEKTMPELLLSKAKEHAENGKTTRIVCTKNQYINTFNH